MKFDWDSLKIGVDNHATTCISPDLKDFVGPIIPSNSSLKIIAAGLAVQGTGAISWNIQDDTRLKHEIIIRDCFLYQNQNFICSLHNTGPKTPTTITHSGEELGLAHLMTHVTYTDLRQSFRKR